MSQQMCCEDKMDLIAVWDDPTGYAFNLYICYTCGTIKKEDVSWENKGLLVIDRKNQITNMQLNPVRKKGV